MTMDNDRDEDPVLNALFDAGRSLPPEPSAAFLARLASDADTAVPQPVARRMPGREPHVFERFAALFAASGLTSAAAVGLWIGFVSPEVIIPASPLAEEVTALSAFLPGSDLSVLSE